VFRIGEDDEGNMVVQANEDGIEILCEGLIELARLEPGIEMEMTAFVQSGDGEPKGVATLILHRLPDDDTAPEPRRI